MKTLNPVRCPWLMSLVVAIVVIISGQVQTLRALDSCDADLNRSGDDVSFSVLDDDFVALLGTTVVDPSHAPVRPLLVLTAPLSGRLVIPDLFRPPTAAAI